ncbi:MAG: hypothetical protein ACT4QB_18925 [Gammaproteobacteria bacterium]
MRLIKRILLTSTMAASFAPGAWANDCGSPGSDQVIVYQDTNRGGACQVLGVGGYPSSFGLPNDSISAIDVGADVRAVVYEHDYFWGRQAHYEGGRYYEPGKAFGWNYELGNENDPSSLEIFPMEGGRAATRYLGNYPSNRENFWSNDAQGLANDGSNWFVVKGYKASNTRIFKVPLSYDLSSSSSKGLVQTGVPLELQNIGYGHFGDPDVDQSSGFLFVPVEASSKSSKPRIAVFSPVDLRFLSSFELSDNPDRTASWLAIRPGQRTLWVSTFNLGGSNQIREYDIDWDRLGVDGQLILSFRRQLTLRDRDGVILNLKSMQGGVFNPEGTLLYISTGYEYLNGYVHVFAIEDDTNTGMLQARSENSYGPFNFETHPWKGDEAEGLDWLDVRGLDVPGIPDGQLHLVMIDNDSWGDSDDLYLKHYSY